jgi:DNA-binding MarR family transcriptional regulator
VTYRIEERAWLVKLFIYRDIPFCDKSYPDPLETTVITLTEALPLDEQLCFAIYSVNIAINRIYRPVLEQLGVTYPQYLVLSALWQRDGQTIGAIAARLSLESSTITPLVKRLQSAGFVERERNQGDERQVIVTLSAKGKSLHQESKCLSEKLLEGSGFPAAQLASLNVEIRALRDALVKDSEELA